MFSSLNYRSIILSSIIFASVLAFLFTGFGRLQVFNFKKMDPNMALIVGNQTVDMLEFSNILTSQGYSNSMPENQKKYLAYQVLNQLVNQKLLLEASQNMGFEANQESIAAFIRSIPAFQDVTTGKFSYEQVKQYMKSQNINEINFFKNIKNELSVQNVSQLLSMPDAYPKSLRKDQYNIQNTAFTLQYALLDINPVILKQKASAQVKEFIENSENDSTLQTAYQSKYKQYNQTAQYKVQSILIAHKDSKRAQGDAQTRTKEEAQHLIDEILNKVQKGELFSKLASQTNDDFSAKNNRGSLGYLDDSAIDPESYQSFNKLTAKKPLSDIVDTPFGFRIFKLEDKKAAVSKTFDEVKSFLAEDLIMEKLRQTEQVDLDSKVQSSFSGSHDYSPLNALLKEQNIQWQELDTPYTIQESSVPKLGSATELAENVFTLKKTGDVIPKILSFGSHKNVLIKLVAIKKPDAPSEESLNSLETQDSNQQSEILMQHVLTNLRESYEKKGKIKMNPELTF